MSLRETVFMTPNRTLTRITPRLAVLAAFLTTPACSLLETDFEGEVRLLFDVQDPDATYQSIDLFDPNENQDFRDNRDRIQSGTVESIEFRFVDIGGDNLAQYVLGQADLRPAGEETAPWIEGVSAWGEVSVTRENVFIVDIPADRQEILTELVFEADEVDPLEIRIDGRANEGPVDFDIEAKLNMVFTAGL